MVQETVSVVTGASRGIGKCLVERLSKRGPVVLVGRDAIGLETVASSCRGTAIPVVGDITRPSTRQDIDVAIGKCHASGRLDVLVNNAGVGAIGAFAEADEERLRTVMEVNFIAPALLTRLLLPRLRSGNRPVVCNVGSVLGHRAVPDKSEYCASKFALHGWSDSLRSELHAEGVAVTLVSPSTTRTDFFSARNMIGTKPQCEIGELRKCSPGDGGRSYTTRH